MRILLAAAAALLLAGCASEPAPVPTAPEPQLVQPEPVDLADGTYPWHPDQAGLFLPLTYFNLASQTVANPCLFEGKPYFNNLDVPTGVAGLGHLPLNGTLRLTLDWGDTDFLGTTLVAAYMAPGQDEYTESARIPRAQAHDERITVTPGSTNADWDLWLCINDDATGTPGDAGYQPGPFMGSVQVKAAFTPDPILDTDLAALEAGAAQAF